MTHNCCFDQIKSELNTCGRVVLFGPAKIGKTLTAINYCQKNQKLYDYLGNCEYFNASSEESLIKDYKEFTCLKNLTKINPEIKKERLIEKVNNYIKENHPFVFIFDNVTDVKILNDFLPPGSVNCHVIITSRNPVSLHDIPNIEIKQFTREESCSYIRKNLSEKCWGGSFKEAFTRLDELASRLDDSPSDLERAVKYMNGRVVSIQNFLDKRFYFEFPEKKPRI